MALIVADQTGGLTQVQATTRPNITQSFLEQTGYGQIGNASSTAGDALSVVDVLMLKSTQYNTKRFVGAFCRLPLGPAGSGTSEFRPITAFAPSTGILTVSPAFSGVVQSGVLYEIWATPIAPQIVLRLLDDILTKDCWLPCSTFPTEVPDGDMEQTGTTAYAASLATLAKVPWAIGKEGVSGTQALSVATTSGNGYGTMAANIQVTPGSLPWFAINGTPDNAAVANTLTVEVRDITNGTSLWRTTSTSSPTVRFAKQIDVPPTCNLINIRFGSVQSGVTSIWDELQVLDLLSDDMPMPWWVNEIDQIKGIHVWEPGQAVSISQDIFAPSFKGPLTREFDFDYERFGSGAVRAMKRRSIVSRPHWMWGVRNETAYANDTEVKRVNENWATAMLAFRMYDALAQAAGHTDKGPLVERRNAWKQQAEEQKMKRQVSRQKYHPARTGWRMIS